MSTPMTSPLATPSARPSTARATSRSTTTTTTTRTTLSCDRCLTSSLSNQDLVALVSIYVDTDCNCSIDPFVPVKLVDTPVDPGLDRPVAQWTGQIASWWTLVITVDQVTGYPYDVSADLTNFSVIHTMCAPQNFIVTVLGRSSPHNDVVLTNPSSAGAYTW